MKATRNLLFCLVALFFTVPTLGGQDLSRYRTLSLGTTLPAILKYTGQKTVDVKVIHSRPALIQEVTWWPSNTSGTTAQPDDVREIVFSLYNGELYKMSVTYDRTSTQGLTTPDMMKAVTAKYGPVTNFVLAIDSPANDQYDLKAKTIASWGDAQYAVDLVRSPFTDDFGLVIYSKRMNADVESAIAESVRLEEQERPTREALRQQKATDDLEATRQKNRKVFQP
ncbi:MAG: hypothetical protein JWO71_810 [Candidatus Acidoferrum typicum]|nr:hypothetical protein [Candidatus Acidoferrum typicum]